MELINNLCELCVWYAPQIFAALVLVLISLTIEQVVYRSSKIVVRRFANINEPTQVDTRRIS